MGIDPEISAISVTYKALEKLAPDAQLRVLDYVSKKLGISVTRQPAAAPTREENAPTESPVHDVAENSETEEQGLDGISPVAQKWMARNGLEAKNLSLIFSLGVDEIDLIAKSIPGKSTKDKMHSVALLKGVAAYLSGGAARFSHEQLKEACLHYKAYDSANFASYIKSFSAEISGSKNSEYVLTARGLSNATDLVKSLSPQDKS